MQHKIRFSILLFVGTLLCNLSAAQERYSTPDYIKKYSDLAVKEMKRTGIPASITMAQGILESGNGNSTLARKSNNHFGIKCHSDWKGKKVYHDDDAKGECFRKYAKVYDSYIDHSEFLTGKQRYASLFTLKTTDYKGWAHGLKKAGYATDPKYAHRLIKIIEDYNLHKLDDKKYKAKATSSGGSNTDNFTVDAFNNHTIERNNGVRYIRVKDGDSFIDICNEFGLKEWEIYSYNDLSKGESIQDHKYLYLSPKKRKAHQSHSTHKLKNGETLEYISQKYGIKLKSIYKLNRLEDGAQPKDGTVINLRKKKKK
ncbi:glucosaminidase domain-containing protein [Saccharicrinis aurantiacus]|uniref:glucosaminidase domain-containing protein n=1 Tax=Saccharicrinis aurantiacus TaxID=1849719 RepID=UPI002491CF11|nr:glucosaminidase domain-containing protein [Saccharicrinis aurantiacus]